jgi:hypothetical protein
MKRGMFDTGRPKKKIVRRKIVRRKTVPIKKVANTRNVRFIVAFEALVLCSSHDKNLKSGFAKSTG